MTYENPVKSAGCECRQIQLDLSSKSRKDKDKLQKGPATSDTLIFPVLLKWKNQGHTSTLSEKHWACSLSCQLLCLSYPTRASRQWIQIMFPYIFHWWLLSRVSFIWLTPGLCAQRIHKDLSCIMSKHKQITLTSKPAATALLYSGRIENSRSSLKAPASHPQQSATEVLLLSLPKHWKRISCIV